MQHMSNKRESQSAYPPNQKGQLHAGATTVPHNLRKSDDTSFVVAFFKKISATAYDIKCAFIKVYSGITQLLVWFVLWPILRFRYKIRVHGRHNLNNLRGPLIIAANHQKFYDAFILRLAISYHGSGLLPLRFMATMNFVDPFLRTVKKTGFIHFLYATTGVFTVEQGLGLNKNLKRAKAILKNKGVVAMFPEGSMNKNGELTMFKRGISALALSTNTKVLPIGIKITNRKKDPTYKGRKPRIDITIGEAKKFETHHTYEELADQLKAKIKSLI